MNLELWSIILIIISVYGLIEITLYFWISFVRKHFQWLITSSDEAPELSKEGLLKFIPLGYDPELGWIRKPNSSHEEKGKFSSIKWTINQKGARTNRGFEDFKATISCYGDSFTFCRQVNDNETWEHHLSKLQNMNVLNFGVGNYGIDQSLLRIKREFPKIKVILGHMGGNDTSVVKKAINAAKDIPNTFFDTSGISTPYRVEYGVSVIGAKRILFGSDFPWCSFRSMYYGVEDALIDDKAKNLIFAENFLNILE